VRQKASYVDADKCTSCAECVAVCPVTEVPDEFNLGMSSRTAIYRSFPQAVPNTFFIDKRGAAPCKVACPIGQDVPGYLAMVAQGKYKEAVQVIRRTNPLPVVCAYCCYHPCEDWCERKDVDESVAIRDLKRFAMDWAVRNNVEMEPPPVQEVRHDKVAIIGSGPAGMAAGHALALKGYRPDIFEAAPVVGGMMALGLPSYRMPREMLKHDLDYLEKMGVVFRPNLALGRDFSITDLKDQGYKAIILAVGTHRGRPLGAESEDLPGIEEGLDFLKQVNLGEEVRMGKKVRIIGAGNSAMDVARTAWRLGAEEVSIVYRRSQEEMPADEEEFKAALEEGVKVQYLTLPTKFHAGDDGRVKSMTCIRMELGAPDESGRRRPVPVEGSEFEMEADSVFLAIGLVPATDYFAGSEDLKLDKWNAPVVEEGSWATSISGVFAAGDLVTGPSSIVQAMRWGKQVALGVDKYLRGEAHGSEVEPLPDPSKIRREDIINPRWKADYSNVPRAARSRMPMIPPEKRVANWDGVETGLPEDVAQAEAARCLQCGICVNCWECVRVCEPKAVVMDDTDKIHEFDVGNIIVATGFGVFDARRAEPLGYGRHANVMSSIEFERLCHSGGPTEGKILTKEGVEPKAVAILHCIGSRDKHYNEYCSRVCCMYSLKFAHLIKEKCENTEVYEMYIDMRCFGKGYEEFYNRLLEEGVHFIRGRGVEVSDYPSMPSTKFAANGNKLYVRCEDTLLGLPREIPVDMVILSVGLEPAADATQVQNLLRISRSKDGFFLEKHPKLAPVNTASDGVFIAGCAQGPKDIPDSVAQGAAAAGAVMSLICAGEVVLEPTTAHMDEDVCTGCGVCLTVCPYEAISRNPETRQAQVTEALCKACGTCVAACPSGAARQWGFDDVQITAELEALLMA
jgi:heterodisulfide reductase subunit A